MLKQSLIDGRWLARLNMADKVEAAHRRHVRRCYLEGGPVALTPGGPAALKIVIRGDSFMLHQIRCWLQRTAFVSHLLETGMDRPLRVLLCISAHAWWSCSKCSSFR